MNTQDLCIPLQKELNWMVRSKVGLTFPGRKGEGFTDKPSMCQVKGQIKCPTACRIYASYSLRIEGVKILVKRNKKIGRFNVDLTRVPYLTNPQKKTKTEEYNCYLVHNCNYEIRLRRSSQSDPILKPAILLHFSSQVFYDISNQFLSRLKNELRYRLQIFDIFTSLLNT